MRESRCYQPMKTIIKSAMKNYHETVFNGPNGEIATLVNLTPHPIDFINGDGEIYKTIPSTGYARVIMHRDYIGKIEGVPIKETYYREVYGLPDPKPGVYYIVSTIVALAVKGTRDDCFTVDAVVKDDYGQSLCCKYLGKV